MPEYGDKSPRTPVGLVALRPRPWLWPAILTAAIVLLEPLLILGEGQPLWCACGRPLPWTSDAWSPHTSQHLLDPYSFTHVLHGVLLWWALAWLAARSGAAWLFPIAAAVEAAWELAENAPFIVERFRTETAAIGYHGDSAANSLGDLVACLAGFWLARRLGWRWSLLVFAVTEFVLIIWIRDSLLLCVLMLVWPSDWVRQWQMAS
jgi:hypothetical protein